ncbi:Calcium-binding allergen Ole e 8 [Sesamum angolense]|uniref:Calcium-binding allergen Ole e 8 n=1 Tax=Sesamum angolense TaxID=2727404 RepID=A0AAE2BS10_9LAMI|nr:Calcium-binding allergen Ole e 8 [Sesamum angolense]
MATDPTHTSTPSMYLDDMAEVQKVFDRFDTNSDGKISPGELGGVLKALGSESSPDEVARMMGEIDTDKDGNINLQEFAAFCSADADPYHSAEKELERGVRALRTRTTTAEISARSSRRPFCALGEHCSVEDLRRDDQAR